MDYQRIYNEIIENRKRHSITGYCENHHIIPRSLGGTDNPENLVSLSAREHFICHLLLTKIHQDTQSYYKMVKAFMMMFKCKSDNQTRYVSSRLYEKLRTDFAVGMSISQSGENNSQSGTMWVYNTITEESKKINKTDLIEDGWVRGRKINGPIIRKSKPNKRLQESDNVRELRRLERLKKSQEKEDARKEIAEKKLKEKEDYLRTLDNWHKIYKEVGFDNFVNITGYKFSKPNLVQTFAANLVDFVPQNGKRRK